MSSVSFRTNLHKAYLKAYWRHSFNPGLHPLCSNMIDTFMMSPFLFSSLLRTLWVATFAVDGLHIISYSYVEPLFRRIGLMQ